MNPVLHEPKNRLERLIAILAISMLAVFIIPRSTRLVADLVWPLVSAFDPEKVFLWLSIRHVLMLIFTVLIMKFFFKKGFRQWGFNLNSLPESLRIFGWFTIFYLGVVVMFQLPNIINATPHSFDYPLTAKNMMGSWDFRSYCLEWQKNHSSEAW